MSSLKILQEVHNSVLKKKKKKKHTMVFSFAYCESSPPPLLLAIPFSRTVLEWIFALVSYTAVEPPITRLIGSGSNLAVWIPRCQMHYGYGKAVMRPVKKSPRYQVIPLNV